MLATSRSSSLELLSSAVRRNLTLALIAVVLWATVPTAALAADEDEPRVSGLVTINGKLAASGTRIAFSKSDDPDVLCVEGATDEGGTFSMLMAPSCADGTTALALLPAIGAESATTYTLDPSKPGLLVQFTGLSEEQLSAVRITSGGGETSGAEAIAEQAVKPLISEDSLKVVLITVIVATTLVLSTMLFLVRKDRLYRVQTEGAILLAVITAIIILGVTGKVTSDGLISVLAAIVGWGAGRSQAGSDQRPKTDAEVGGVGAE